MNGISNKNYWLVDQAKNYPSQIALQETKISYTYTKLLDTSINAANKFSSMGIQSGDHISILSNNSFEFVITINALWLLGAVPIPLNIKLKHNEIEKLVLHSQSKMLLNINNVVAASKLKFANTHSISINDFSVSNLTLQKEKFNSKNIALMMYSSGSTGKPKCVQLTFSNLFESAKSLQSIIKIDTKDVWLASLPFYHIGGFSIITRSLLFGNMLVFIKSFSAKEMIKSFNQLEPTHFSIVPTLLKKILDEKIRPWKKLKSIFIGGGPLNKEDVLKAIELGFPLVGVYGSTETSSMVTAVTEKNIFSKSGCAGKPLSGNSVEIIDSKGKKLSKMETGEIVISSKSVAKSYFNYTEKNGSKIFNQKFYSNDLGYLDEEGNLFLKGRKDDIIISGGENININEVEILVKSFDEVSECTTIKVSDDKWGESFLLLVVLSDINNKTKILEKLKENVANFKQPKRTYFVDVLYRNQLGKVDKNRHLEELGL